MSSRAVQSLEEPNAIARIPTSPIICTDCHEKPDVLRPQQAREGGRPHYLFAELHRATQGFFARAPELGYFTRFLPENPRLTQVEVQRLAVILASHRNAARSDPVFRRSLRPALQALLNYAGRWEMLRFESVGDLLNSTIQDLDR
jgi:hypothetical protein